VPVDLTNYEFNLIVPKSVIEEKYPGGWKACLEYHDPWIGGSVSCDDGLLQIGADTKPDIERARSWFVAIGFDEFTRPKNSPVYEWTDLCVIGPEDRDSIDDLKWCIPCMWLRVDDGVAQLANKYWDWSNTRKRVGLTD